MDKKVYVLTETICYTDFETHYETEVKGVFDDRQIAADALIAFAQLNELEPAGFGPYGADEVERSYSVKEFKLNNRIFN
jgi:hypothetical protein